MLAKDRVVVSVVSKIQTTGYWLWSRLFYTASASNRRRIVEIQLCVGRVAASFSAAHVRKMWRTAERRFMRHICLRNPCLLWNPSIHSLPEAWGPWESASTLHQLCSMLASCLQKIELWYQWYPRYSLQDIDCDLGCFIRRLLQTDEEDEEL